MIWKLLKALVVLRPVLLTDLMNVPDEVKCWVFEKLGTHPGVVSMCPGWCRCSVDTDPGEEELAWTAA